MPRPGPSAPLGRRSLRAAAMCAALLAAVVAAPTHATLLVYEPFDYPAGSVLEDVPATGLGLTGSYTAPGIITGFELRAGAPGLDYGSLGNVPPAAAQRLTQATGTTTGIALVNVASFVPGGPGEAFFWSALFTFDDSGNGNRLAHVTFDDGAGGTIGFGESAVGVRAIRLEANTPATGGLVVDSADGSFVDGQTLLLLGRYLNAAEAGGDRLDLLVYDTADADVLPASFDPSDLQAERAFSLTGLDLDFLGIASIRFDIRGSDDNFIDELRIGSTFASVIPEPGTGLLLLAGLAVLAARRRSGNASGTHHTPVRGGPALRELTIRPWSPRPSARPGP